MGDAASPQPEGPVIRLGISTCLLGERVRYDGGHKLDRFLVQTLGRYVEWVPVCPEVEIGLPVPRESMRLVGEAENPRLVAPKSGSDYTERYCQMLWIGRPSAASIQGMGTNESSESGLHCSISASPSGNSTPALTRATR